MALIALDVSANTHKNSKKYLRRMIDEIAAIDSRKHKIVFKHQLFVSAGKNIPLMPDVFEDAYEYADLKGYKTTSSVFDLDSLNYLLDDFTVPFVKIANNRKLDYLKGYVPRNIPIVTSYGSEAELSEGENSYNEISLVCVSNYPAAIEQYEFAFENVLPFIQNSDRLGISDHTPNFELFNKYKPNFLEIHYKLECSTGLDAGPFARTPRQLEEILSET